MKLKESLADELIKIKRANELIKIIENSKNELDKLGYDISDIIS